MSAHLEPLLQDIEKVGPELRVCLKQGYDLTIAQGNFL